MSRSGHGQPSPRPRKFVSLTQAERHHVGNPTAVRTPPGRMPQSDCGFAEVQRHAWEVQRTALTHDHALCSLFARASTPATLGRRTRRETGVKRIAIASLSVAGAAAAIVVAQAIATPGSGAVSNYVARGPVSQSGVIGVPKTATATKTVRVRVNGKVVTKKVSFTYPTVTPLMTCGSSTPCDTAYQQLTIPPGGFTGWHTHPGPTFVAVAQGEGTLYHGMSGCPSFKYATG